MSKTYSFPDNEKIGRADEVNRNFNDLYTYINIINKLYDRAPAANPSDFASGEHIYPSQINPVFDNLTQIVNDLNDLPGLSSPLLYDSDQVFSSTDIFGEDHDYSVNPPSFTDNGNGTVTDDKSGLIWQKVEDNIFRKWNDASNYCADLSLGGFDDWRLPTFQELKSILSFKNSSNFIDSQLFTNVFLGFFWSSTIYQDPDGNDMRWILYYFDGEFAQAETTGYEAKTRCVRGINNVEQPMEYADLRNGLIFHNDTRLMWQKDNDNIKGSWEQAIIYCEDLYLSGYSDWRLPNITELHSIVDYSTAAPGFNNDFFPSNKNAFYWSSTNDGSSGVQAFVLNSVNGGITYHNKSYIHHFHCVRGGSAAQTIFPNQLNNDFDRLYDKLNEINTNKNLLLAELVKSFTFNETISAGQLNQNFDELYQRTNFMLTIHALPTILKPHDFDTNEDVVLSRVNKNFAQLYLAINDLIYTPIFVLLPDTGQTDSYTETFGEDHDYLENHPSYSDNGNGTVFDNNTRLTWQQEDDDIGRSWFEAESYCTSLSLAGYDDWRLPNVKELMSIVSFAINNSAIDTEFFPNTNAAEYWSSTPYVNNINSAWPVNFSSGLAINTNKSSSSFVRCVRGQSDSTIWPFDYSDIENSITYHSSTHLMWQKEADRVARTWEQALTSCQDLTLGGYEDWRLPNIKELQSINDYNSLNPSIDLIFLPNTVTSFYWSSTSNADISDNAWGVYFGNGMVHDSDKSSTLYTRCVRNKDQLTTLSPIQLNSDFDAVYGILNKINSDRGLSLTNLIKTHTFNETVADLQLNQNFDELYDRINLFLTLHVLPKITKPFDFYSNDEVNPNRIVINFNQLYSAIEDLKNSPISLPDTGQVNSYTDTYGEDSDYLANNPSFSNLGSWMVTDDNTRLVWQSRDDGLLRNWSQAESYCANKNTAGYDDWRLPNVKELLSIVSFANNNPAIDSAYFPNTSASSYWSSTQSSNGPNLAWYVNFDQGVSFSVDKSNSYLVRCVRGRGDSSIWVFNYTDTENIITYQASTRLMWQKSADLITRSWEQAIDRCEQLTLGGYSDWRLPNIKELQTIIDYSLPDLVLDKSFFPNTPAGSFWSSTTQTDATDKAWTVYFRIGSIYGSTKTSNFYTRCVRTH